MQNEHTTGASPQEERVFLSYDDAVAMIPDKGTVHVFTNPGIGILVGSDWERESILKVLAECNPELSGQVATEMKHGIHVANHWPPLFIETTGGAA